MAFNLALLVFKPVRKSWQWWFPHCYSINELWKGLFNPEVIGEDKWWKKPFIFVVFILVLPVYLLYAILSTLIPILVYRDAIAKYKREKEIAQIKASLCKVPPPEKWGENTDLSDIHISLDLPFEPDIHDVFYVENEYDPIVNGFIQEHYEEIQKQFGKKDLNFIYLPKLVGQDVPSEVLQYMFPYLNLDTSYKNDDDSVETLRRHIISGVIERPALLHRIRLVTDDEYYYFSHCPLVPDSEVSLSDQFEWYTCHTSLAYGGGRYMFHIVDEKKEDADDNFVDDVDALATKSNLDLAEEIRERIKELRRRGVQLNMLNEFVEEKPTLSRMVITKDYRIYLPDYNNIEITMSPLPKSVFLLFLRHPEGIPFKQLTDYREELLDIYKEVGNRVVERNVRNSIRDITDPTNNSINEKCARIREAFLKHFDTPYARNYYITGKRGEPKKITLPRELVDLQAL